MGVGFRVDALGHNIQTDRGEGLSVLRTKQHTIIMFAPKKKSSRSFPGLGQLCGRSLQRTEGIWRCGTDDTMPLENGRDEILVAVARTRFS